MSEWVLVYRDFDPGQEGLREALCTLGNGYFATRGAAPEAAADDYHYPGTYVAGLFNRLETEVEGRVIENEDMVNVPNWLPLRFRMAGGDWVDLRAVEVLDYEQRLELRAGVLVRSFVFVEEGRRTRVAQRRFVGMDDPTWRAWRRPSSRRTGRGHWRCARSWTVRSPTPVCPAIASWPTST